MDPQQPLPSPAGLPRAAILRGKEPIRALFQEGKGFRQGNIVVKYRIVTPLNSGSLPETAGLQPAVIAGFIVRKGNGGAIRRTRIRRLLRESYRLIRHRFLQGLPPGVTLHLALLWSVPKEQSLLPPPPFADVQNDVRRGLERLHRKVMKESQDHEPTIAGD
jgi:ribonuclease P protein component